MNRQLVLVCLDIPSLTRILQKDGLDSGGRKWIAQLIIWSFQLPDETPEINIRSFVWFLEHIGRKCNSLMTTVYYFHLVFTFGFNRKNSFQNCWPNVIWGSSPRNKTSYIWTIFSLNATYNYILDNDFT